MLNNYYIDKYVKIMTKINGEKEGGMRIEEEEEENEKGEGAFGRNEESKRKDRNGEMGYRKRKNFKEVIRQNAHGSKNKTHNGAHGYSKNHKSENLIQYPAYNDQTYQPYRR